jgi:hypothetical protein
MQGTRTSAILLPQRFAPLMPGVGLLLISSQESHSKMKLMVQRSLAITGILIIVVGSSCTAVRQTYDEGYKAATLKSNEDLLRKNLKALREVIEQYSRDKGALPQTLDDVVKAGYINEIPGDPITEKPDWKIVVGEKTLRSKKQSGIIDVRSSSTATSSENTPYSTW